MLRKADDNGKFGLDQIMFLNLLFQQWGGKKVTAEVTDNDKLRLFGILMNVEMNKYILSRLSEGIKERAQLDDSQ